MRAAIAKRAALLVTLLFASPLFATAALADSALLNDYPTEARADYVFACMSVNGQNRNILRKCSCSIDRIAALMPYDKYVEAETVLSLRQVGGERMSMFKTTQIAKELVAELRRAQAEAEIICFQ